MQEQDNLFLGENITFVILLRGQIRINQCNDRLNTKIRVSTDYFEQYELFSIVERLKDAVVVDKIWKRRAKMCAKKSHIESDAEQLAIRMTVARAGGFAGFVKYICFEL